MAEKSPLLLGSNVRGRKRVSEHEKNSDKKYRCWISEKEKILSFGFEEGYKLIEFDSYQEFQDYYYRKTYWGYRAQ